MKMRAALTCLLLRVAAAWDNWWSYDGITGPEFWRLNVDWRICIDGHKQSPIDIDPSLLLFDDHMRFIHIDKHRISGTLNNTGRDVTFTAETATPVLISGGPLSYQYTFQSFHLHFGTVNRERPGSESINGSEHRIGTRQFPAEIQLLGYNSHLYKSFAEAVRQPHGIVGIAILIEIGQEPNAELRIVTEAVTRITYKGDHTRLSEISLQLVRPRTEQFVTYQGSLTTPACHETVTWIVFNKPIYMSRQQLHMLQKLQSENRSAKYVSGLGNNFRPPRPLHHRVVRTNIDTRAKNGRGCPPPKGKMAYKASEWLGV